MPDVSRTMKLALCIVLFACSSALGYVAADGLRQRCKAIETLQGILDTLGVRLRYYQEPLSQAVRSTAQSIEGAPHDFLSMLAQQLGAGYSPAESLERTMADRTRAVGFRESLGKEEKLILEEMFERIGSHREDQEAAFALCEQRLTQQLANARQEWQQKGRLYRMMGVLGGAIWLILFL